MADWAEGARISEFGKTVGPCEVEGGTDLGCGRVGAAYTTICCTEAIAQFEKDQKPQLVASWNVVDPTTGGEKGQKDVQMSMVPVPFLEDLARLYAAGAKKYTRDNWRKGYAWHLSLDALYRHLFEMSKGNWIDPETGLPHIIAIAWHCAALHTFYNEGLGTNDLF